MLQRKLTIYQVILIGINLLPVIGVWFQGWDAARIFLFYCLETILIGIFHVIKMALVMLLSQPGEALPAKQKGGAILLGLFIIGFFILHYGIFVFVQTSMFFAISGVYKGDLFGLNLTTLKELLGREGMLMMAIFIVYYILQTIREGILFRIDKMSDIVKLMFQPYLRIFIQQFVLIFGSMFLAFGLGNIFILVFIVIRIYIETFFNWNQKVESAFEKNKLKMDNTGSK